MNKHNPAKITWIWNIAKRALLLHFWDFSKEDYEKEFDSAFNEAKNASDFVGFIVRYTFCVIAYVYFITLTKNASTLIIIIYAYASGVFALISIYIATRIGFIILLYFSSDLYYAEGKLYKSLLHIIVIFTTISIFIAINFMVLDFASISPMLSKSPQSTP